MAGAHQKRIKQSDVSAKCHRFLRIVGPLLVAPLCITSFVYTCIYAYIYATENSYGSDDWQKCLVVPNIGNLHLDNNKYCTSASNFAGQAYLSLLVALVGAHIGLVDNALLPVSIYTSIVAIVGILVFREAYPYYDDPHFMSTTLVTLTHYIRPTMYDNLAENSIMPEPIQSKIPSSEVCKKAYHVNLAFLLVQYGILAVAVLLLVMCTYAYMCSGHCMSRRRPLKHAWLHPLFALLTFGANLTMLVSKEIVADTAVKIARSTGHPTVYQFLDNNLDMVAITTLLAIGAALYGYCRMELTAIKLCGCIGFIHLTRSLPGLLGTLAGYSGINIYDFEMKRATPPLQIIEKYYVIWRHEECIQYVIDTNKSSFKSDDDAQSDAGVMCRAFVSSISGQVATYLCIAGLVLASIAVVRANSENPNNPKPPGRTDESNGWPADKDDWRRRTASSESVRSWARGEENGGVDATAAASLLLNGFLFDDAAEELKDPSPFGDYEDEEDGGGGARRAAV